MAKGHPRKEIREAIGYAVERGWELIDAGPRAHLFGTLRCPEGSRAGCQVHVASTPRSAGNHSRRIIRAVDQCPHQDQR